MSERLFGVIGAGTIGTGIAQTAASAGFIVATLDTDPERVKAAYGKIVEHLNRAVEQGDLPAHERDATVERLRVASDIETVKEAEVIVESVPEDLQLKKKIFQDLDAVVSGRTLLATSTSSLSIAKITEGLRNAHRVLGMHFFNPPPEMKLIEVVLGPQTEEQAWVDARAICAKLDKIAAKVQDSPGFIGSRVNRPYHLEALSLLETGEADIQSIDAALRDVGGFGKGPFELLDQVGLDEDLKMTEALYRDLGEPARFSPGAVQQQLVGQGHLGCKTGRGFYDHSDGRLVPYFETALKDSTSWKPTQALLDFARQLQRPADRAMWIYARVFMAIMNEAALVADSIAIPRDVNLTMEHGFAYPEGPLATADFIGLDIIQRLLADFYEESGQDERYKSNPLLNKRVEDGDLGESTARGFLYHAL